MQIFSNEGLQIVGDVKMGRGKMQTATSLMQICSASASRTNFRSWWSTICVDCLNLFNYIHIRALCILHLYKRAQRQREIRRFD
jgi:hypothetical protein